MVACLLRFDGCVFLFSCCCGVFLGAQHLCGTVRFDGSLVWFGLFLVVLFGCVGCQRVDRMVSRDFFSFFLLATNRAWLLEKYAEKQKTCPAGKSIPFFNF